MRKLSILLILSLLLTCLPAGGFAEEIPEAPMSGPAGSAPVKSSLYVIPETVIAPVGEQVTFTVSQTGNNYVWEMRRGEEEPWEPVPDGNAASLTVEVTEDLDGCQFRCKVVKFNPNTLSATGVFSDYATLTVGEPEELPETGELPETEELPEIEEVIEPDEEIETEEVPGDEPADARTEEPAAEDEEISGPEEIENADPEEVPVDTEEDEPAVVGADWTAAPTNLQASVSGNNVLLSWTGNGGAATYAVFDVNQESGDEFFVASVDGESLTIPGLLDGTYTFTVKPYHDDGEVNGYGEASAPVTFTVAAWKEAPANVTAVAEDNIVTLTWIGNAYTEMYSVYEMDGTKPVYKMYVTGETAQLKNVSDGSHTYIVRPRVETEEKAEVGYASEPVTVEVHDWRTAPTDVAASAENGTVTVTWTKNSVCDTYSVYEVTEDTAQFRTYVTGDTAQIRKVSEGEHTYFVRPRMETEEKAVTGHASEPVTVTVEAWVEEPEETAEEEAVPEEPWKAAPTDVAASAENGTVTITWTQNPACDMYSVYEVLEDAVSFKTYVTGDTAQIRKVSEGEHTYFVRPRMETEEKAVTGHASEPVTVTVEAWVEEPEETEEEEAVPEEPWKAAPTDVAASAENGTVTITWTQNPACDMYSVYEVLEDAVSFKTYVTGDTAQIRKVSEGEHTYFVRPRMETEEKAVTGHASEPVTVTVEAWVEEPEETEEEEAAPEEPWKAAPTDVAASAENGTVTITWTQNPACDMYSVYEVLEDAVSFKTYVTGDTAQIRKVSEGEHTYFVRPRMETEEKAVTGHASEPVTVTVEAWVEEPEETEEEEAAPEEPWKAAPTQVDARVENGTVTITWTKNPECGMYSVYEVKDDAVEFRTYVTAESAELKNVSNGVHTYFVRPRMETEENVLVGRASEQVSVLVDDWRAAPADVNAAAEGTTVTISWTKNKYCEMYSVYELIGETVAFRTFVTAESAVLSNVSAGSHTYIVRPRMVLEEEQAVVGEASEPVTVTVAE